MMPGPLPPIWLNILCVSGPPPHFVCLGKLLAYNCSPSFNWKKKLSDEAIASFQKDIGAMGFK